MTRLGIKEVFQLSQGLDVAIVSVGNRSPNSTMNRFSLLSRDDVASLERAGAVGDVLCRFIDAEGEVIDHPVNKRVIAADPAKLRSARKVILSPGGWAKAP